LEASLRSDIKERAEASRHPCEDGDVAAFSHGSEAGPPELSAHSIAIAEGVVPGAGVAGVASDCQ
jgi:hypothetical protein